MPDRRTSRQCPHLEVRYNRRARVPLKSAPSSWGASGVWALHPIPVGLLGSLGPQRSAPKPLHDRLIRFCWVHRCAKQIGRHSDHGDGVCDMQAMAIGRMRIYAMHAMPLRRGPVGKICTVHRPTRATYQCLTTASHRALGIPHCIHLCVLGYIQ